MAKSNLGNLIYIKSHEVLNNYTHLMKQEHINTITYN
jgi:hypothetical protein